jgi:DNA-binding XRE family transcriptional regulator
MMAKTWDRAAMRFASAKYSDEQKMLDITFENGDRFLVAVESVLPWASEAPLGCATTRAARITATIRPMAWKRLRIGETGDVLEIPADDTVIEIPWDRIRAIADPYFRAHLAEHAQERARRIGGRVRSMRLKAGLTPSAVAEKVGVSPEVIAKLEAGEIEPQSDLIQHIAGVLGRRLRDFVEE